MLFVGFFAGLQTAFGSLNRFSVELKKKQGVASGRIISFFIENQSRFIGALLVAVTLSLVVFVLLVNRFFDPLWKRSLNQESVFLFRKCHSPHVFTPRGIIPEKFSRGW